ncbi:polysaccharide deacetylase family protein [Haloglomus litoreum]|uniref:polysaccharide deacetylase family protein n=1 Tax=Haloglomus litoreum TaxID=3034026 RepID=UPI0023E8216A|nr:polysaccharide deacetylase family protein [Haloglomus sp. DT116]
MTTRIDPPTNAISFDLEHWHSATLVADSVQDPVDRIEQSTAIVLDLLDRHDVRATFFVVGEVAAAYPDLVGRIAAAGHEIASHGHTHTPLFQLTPREFDDELRRAAAAIGDAAGVEPVGFRAPNFSVTPRTEWAFPVLEVNGYRYDSSVFPVRTPMYGVNRAAIEPHPVEPAAPFRAGDDTTTEGGLVEVPVAVAGPLLRLPVAGGFYGRFLPTRILHWAIERIQRRGVPATLYFHPWEFNPDVPTDEPAIHERFVSFTGIDGAAAKLDRLLQSFEWGPVRSVVERVRNPSADEPGPHVAQDRHGELRSVRETAATRQGR